MKTAKLLHSHGHSDQRPLTNEVSWALILATDVHYGDVGARAAGVLFDAWTDSQAARSLTITVSQAARYQPGQFYRRELPCLMQLLGETHDQLSAIVVDGYVDLGPNLKPGLGRHLFEQLDRSIPVVGVAKNRFAGTPAGHEVFRGSSCTPLFVTAAGMCLKDARLAVRTMHGPYRIPTLLKRVDQLCRNGGRP